MIALQLIFVMSMILWRKTYSSGSSIQKKGCTDLLFLEYRFERISFTLIQNLLRLAKKYIPSTR